MNLLTLLLKAMLTNNSVSSVSNKTGLSSALVKKLIVAAVPLLIKYMTKNASTTSGAQSLLGALAQHSSKRSLSQQIEEVDVEDGEKIINHILGDDKKLVVKELAAETGATNEQVTKGLASLAPALLSGLFSATNTAHQNQQSSNAGDLSSLLGLLTGTTQQQAQTSSSNDLLSLLFGGTQQAQQTQQSANPFASLFGGTTQQQTSSNGLASLFGLTPQQSTTQQAQTNSSAALNSLFGTLLGGSSQQTTAQQAQQPSVTVIPLTGSSSSSANSSTAAFDGSQLLNLLTALMK